MGAHGRAAGRGGVGEKKGGGGGWVCVVLVPSGVHDTRGQRQTRVASAGPKGQGMGCMQQGLGTWQSWCPHSHHGRDFANSCTHGHAHACTSPPSFPSPVYKPNADARTWCAQKALPFSPTAQGAVTQCATLRGAPPLTRARTAGAAWQRVLLAQEHTHDTCQGRRRGTLGDMLRHRSPERQWRGMAACAFGPRAHARHMPGKGEGRARRHAAPPLTRAPMAWHGSTCFSLKSTRTTHAREGGGAR